MAATSAREAWPPGTSVPPLPFSTPADTAHSIAGTAQEDTAPPSANPSSAAVAVAAALRGLDNRRISGYNEDG